MKTLIKNAKIIDGTGNNAFFGDVLIEDSRIIRVSQEIKEHTEKLFEAGGRTLTPGFIDSHSHSDTNVLVYPTNELALLQGVTTTITGQCGLAASPLCDDYAYWTNCYDIEDFYGEEKSMFDNMKDMKKLMAEKYGILEDFSTTESFMSLVEKRGTSFNLIQLAGHNNLRAAVMGRDASRHATDDEIEKMCVLLEKELASGCVGMSSGLDYYPGCFCETKELVALCCILKKYDAVYTTHVRIVQQGDDGMPFKGELIGILEAIDIARKSGVKLHISHVLPYNYHTDDENSYIRAHDAKIIKKVINNAIAEGIDVTYDVMMGENGGNDRGYLAALMMPWIKECGSTDEFHKRLFDDSFIEKICKEVEEVKYINLSMLWEPTLDDWILISRCSDKRFEGKTIRVIARELGCGHMQAICEVLKSDIDAGLYHRIACIKNEFLKDITNNPACFPSCDGYSFDVGGALGEDEKLGIVPSWLCYNFAIRFIKEFGEARLEDTIKRMTSYPALKHGVQERGLIKEGYFADIVLLDEDRLEVNQDISKKKAAPMGIDYVFVNGVMTVEKGIHTGARAGCFIKRQH